MCKEIICPCLVMQCAFAWEIKCINSMKLHVHKLFTLLQYSIQTSYSLSVDAILHCKLWACRQKSSR